MNRGHQRRHWVAIAKRRAASRRSSSVCAAAARPRRGGGRRCRTGPSVDANAAAIAAAGGIARRVLELPTRQRFQGAGRRRRSGLAINAANQVAIAEAGAIAPLVELVRGGSAVAKAYAAGALHNLPLNDANAAAIAAAGGVAPLEQLARDGEGERPGLGDEGARTPRAVPAEQLAAAARRPRIERRGGGGGGRRRRAHQASEGRARCAPPPPRGGGRRRRHARAPEELACSITLSGSEAMIDPAIDALGNTYERSAIQRWLRDHNTSPLTGAVLPHKDLVPNHALWSTIENWEKKAHEECMAKAAAAAARAAAAEAAARRERRKAERVAAGVDEHMPEPPKRFTCPMTGEVMTDPVIDAAGNTYERANIEQWLQENKTAPLTGANKLKSFIEEWEEEQHEDCMAMARPLKKAKVAWPRATLWQ